MNRDCGFMSDLLEQAQNAKRPALMLTLDLSVPGARWRNLRLGLAGAPGLLDSCVVLSCLEAVVRRAWVFDGDMGGAQPGRCRPRVEGRAGA